MEFIEGLPLSKGYNVIMVIVNMLIGLAMRQVWDGSPISHSSPKIYTSFPYPSRTPDEAGSQVMQELL